MSDLSAFSETYTEARAKFLAAVARHNGKIVSYEHTEVRGPVGERLFFDVAQIGEPTAPRVLVVGCGTHGIEGYSGSAAQTHWLNTLPPDSLPSNVQVVFFHAHNPWGFAHALRYTEEHVDLNRNFIDFAKPLPQNDGYAQAHTFIDFPVWDDATVAAGFAKLDAWRESVGEQAFSDAFNGGQYSHADGIFYGGVREQWSNRTFRRAVTEHLSDAKEVAFIDFHTGIGPRDGHVFLCFHPEGSPGYQKAKAWWGERAVNREGVTHKALASYQGLLIDAFIDMLAPCPATVTVVEFGTLPRPGMQRASLAMRWLWANPDADAAVRDRLMDEIREAFYPSSPTWRAAVRDQSHTMIQQAVDGLAAL